jgi:hypothetical protein
MDMDETRIRRDMQRDLPNGGANRKIRVIRVIRGQKFRSFDFGYTQDIHLRHHGSQLVFGRYGSALGQVEQHVEAIAELRVEPQRLEMFRNPSKSQSQCNASGPVFVPYRTNSGPA